MFGRPTKVQCDGYYGPRRCESSLGPQNLGERDCHQKRHRIRDVMSRQAHPKMQSVCLAMNGSCSNTQRVKLDSEGRRAGGIAKGIGNAEMPTKILTFLTATTLP